MIIDGKKISIAIKEKLKREINNYVIKPCLCVINIGNDESSKIYIKNKRKACEYIGMDFKLIHFDGNVNEDIIISEIDKLNNDDRINGIIVQLPLPNKFNARKIINRIKYEKDVDGLTDISIGKLVDNCSLFIPCTPKGIMKLIDNYKIQLKGKHVVIVGRSILVGKPLLQECLKRDATVTICHSKTKDLECFTKQADILMVATGKRNLIKEDMVKDGVVIIDIGINKFNDKIYGDVTLKAKNKAELYTPVPGGVGPMTVTMLLENTLISYKNKKTN